MPGPDLTTIAVQIPKLTFGAEDATRAGAGKLTRIASAAEADRRRDSFRPQNNHSNSK